MNPHADTTKTPGQHHLHYTAGINNWALSKSQSLAALAELERLVVAVLGGDVYQINDGRADDRGEGWYCDPEADEPNQRFVSRSIEKARDYITRYPELSPEPLFAIVPDIKPSGRPLWPTLVR
jgi:hypothetical protein